MSRSITASPSELMRQARITTEEYYDGAIRYLDEQFGEGYAQNHPLAVQAYVQSCTYDYATSIFLMAIEQVADAIKNSSELKE